MASGGGLTGTRPTGSTTLVQNIGRVFRVNSNNGEILVLGPGRSNDVPNLIGTGYLATSGTASSTTYLRGDQTWASLPAAKGYVVAGQDEGSTVTEPTSVTSLLDSTVTLPACAAGDVLNIRGGLSLVQSSGTTKNITVTLKLGSTTVLTWLFNSLSSSASTRAVTFAATIRVEGTSDINATGYLTHNVSGGTGNTATANGVATENIGSGSLALDLTGQTSASGATQTFALQSFSVMRSTL